MSVLLTLVTKLMGPCSRNNVLLTPTLIARLGRLTVVVFLVVAVGCDVVSARVCVCVWFCTLPPPVAVCNQSATLLGHMGIRHCGLVASSFCLKTPAYHRHGHSSRPFVGCHPVHVNGVHRATTLQHVVAVAASIVLSILS